MHAANLAGTHQLPDGSTIDITVLGNVAELRGTDADGEATFTTIMPMAQVAAILGEATV